MSIDHGAAEFPYEQLAAILRGRIADGTYPPGRKIPSLLALQEEFGLSSMTVRRAVAALADEGLLRVVPGRGTFTQVRKLNGAMPAIMPAHKVHVCAYMHTLDRAPDGGYGACVHQCACVHTKAP